MSERCTLYNPWKILATVAGVRRLGHRTGPEGKEAEKGKEASVTLYNWRSSLSCCITAIPLGLKNYHQMYHSQWRQFFFGSILWEEWVPGWKKYSCQERRGAYTNTIASWGKPDNWITHTLHDGNVWPKLIWIFRVWLILRCWGKSSILCQQNSDAL